MFELLWLEKRYDGSFIVFTSAYVEAEVMWCFSWNGIAIGEAIWAKNKQHWMLARGLNLLK